MHFRFVEVGFGVVLFGQGGFKVVRKNGTDHFQLIILAVVFNIAGAYMYGVRGFNGMFRGH
jgi:hypothetical protein